MAKEGIFVVANRDARQMCEELLTVRYEDVINAIDWNRVLLQAAGIHLSECTLQIYIDDERLKPKFSVCPSCVRQVLLRSDE